MAPMGEPIGGVVYSVRRRVIGLLAAVALMVCAPTSVQGATPFLMVDHQTFTSPSGPFRWAQADLELAIGWDLVTGYDQGRVSRDLSDVMPHGQSTESLPGLAGTPSPYSPGQPVQLSLPTAPLFGAGRQVTRAEFAAILARVTGDDQTYRPGSFAPFRDTPKESWYQRYLAPLVDRQVIRLTDYFLDQLKPDSPITRAEIAAWVARSAQVHGLGVGARPLSFTDVPRRYQYEQELGQAVALGIITGYPDGSFRPDETATRAEAVVMIVRLVKKLSQAAPEISTLQRAAQEAWTAYDRFMRDSRKPIPDLEDLRKTLGAYYAPSALEWWVMDSQDSTLCPPPAAGVDVAGGLLCGASEGFPNMHGLSRFFSLVASHVYDRSDRDYWYQIRSVKKVEPILITDRFAVVSVQTDVYPVTISRGKSLAPLIQTQQVYLRLDGSQWRVSYVK